jgi:hypothetical protein
MPMSWRQKVAKELAWGILGNKSFTQLKLDSIAWAQRVLAAEKENAAKGVGAFVVDNQMVDRPLIVKAHQIVGKATLCGLLPKEQK